MSRLQIIIVLLAIVFGIARLFVSPHSLSGADLVVNIYKDAAHVFIGFLAAVGYVNNDKVCKLSFWLLCILEVTVAFVSRM